MARPEISIGQVMGLVKSFFGENAYTKDEVYTKTEVNEAIENSQHLKRQIVDKLPTGDDIDINTIYMVPKNAKAADNYEDYIWDVDISDWEYMGSSSVDLTDYYNKTQVDGLLANKITVGGQAVASVDFTLTGTTLAITTTALS